MGGAMAQETMMAVLVAVDNILGLLEGTLVLSRRRSWQFSLERRQRASPSQYPIETAYAHRFFRIWGICHFMHMFESRFPRELADSAVCGADVNATTEASAHDAFSTDSLCWMGLWTIAFVNGVMVAYPFAFFP